MTSEGGSRMNENIEDLPDDIGMNNLDEIDYLTMLAEMEYR
jgi:hypothetical protein